MLNTTYINQKNVKEMLRRSYLSLSIWLICIAVAKCNHVDKRNTRQLPTTYNLAAHRPISSIPADSTCGLPDRNDYCVRSTEKNSTEKCKRKFCQMGCRQGSRTRLSKSFNFLEAISPGFSLCVERDTVNIRPGAVSPSFSIFITRPGLLCFLTPKISPLSGINISLSITSWIWINHITDIGTLLEKQSPSGDLILNVGVGKGGVKVTFSTLTGLQYAVLLNSLEIEVWTHLAITVYNRSVSVFINGLEPDFRPSSTVFLNGTFFDKSGKYKVAQSFDGSRQFLGRIQDLLFFSTTLSNREVGEVYAGVLIATRVQSDCRCPPAAPRVNPLDTRYCMSNGVSSSVANTVLRISDMSHPLQYANDDDVNSVWISKFQQNVTLEVDLGDQFEVFQVGLEFYSFLPKTLTIEKLVHESGNFQTWQHYSKNCLLYFGMNSSVPLKTEKDVSCIDIRESVITHSYTQSHILFTLVSHDRPGVDNYYNNTAFNSFVQASRVRLSMHGHQLTEHPRHQYFGIYEITINGRCDCHGHAETCLTDTLPYRCKCSEDSHTQGHKCEQCQPLFNDKLFRRSGLRHDQDFPCKPCQCYNHSDLCVYNVSVDPFPHSWSDGGGGQCVGCQHFTEGRSCSQCMDGFYRPLGISLFGEGVCQPCACNTAGTVHGLTSCLKEGGQCPCSVSTTGRTCGQCKPGSYSLQSDDMDGCTPCQCDTDGTMQSNVSCHQVTGDCFCKQYVTGRRCENCEVGFFNLSVQNTYGCQNCACNPQGSVSPACNPLTGQCFCKSNIGSAKCDQCEDGFFNFSANCLPCNCNESGTVSGTTCDKFTGKCVCKSLTTDRHCDQCQVGSYGFGSANDSGCTKCLCGKAGISGNSTDCDRGCQCKTNVDGELCDRCKPNYWNLTEQDESGCQACDCDVTGVDVNYLCYQSSGQCICLPNRVGWHCDDCETGFFKSQKKTGGCLPCACNLDGTLPGTDCESNNGHCSCRSHDGIGGVYCDKCLHSFYRYRSGRCLSCGCLASGSVSDACHSMTGQCECKLLVTGLTCDRCVTGASNLVSTNPMGCSKKPSQQPSPGHFVINSSSWNISWSQPDYPNGVINSYRLFRDGDVIYEGIVQHFVDKGLTPYSLYTYSVEASNDVGSTLSTDVVFRTPSGVPTSDIALQVDNVMSAGATFLWTVPSQMNGPLREFQLVSYQNRSEAVEWTGTETQAHLASLSAYHRYEVIIRACTDASCSESKPVFFVTKEAPPSGMQVPTVTPVSDSDLLIEWQSPLHPNGVILSYELWMRGGLERDGEHNLVETRIFHTTGQHDPLQLGTTILPPPHTDYIMSGLQPFTVYQFQVLAQNEVGRAVSHPWVSAFTMEAEPVFMEMPTVSGTSSTSVNITWHVPKIHEIRGNVTLYRLYRLVNLTTTSDAAVVSNLFWQLTVELFRLTTHYLLDDLAPYSTYTFYVEACNSVGCVNSDMSSGQTFADAPAGIEKPIVDSFNSTVMQITWRPPVFPNGPDPVYTVQKTNIPLSYPTSVVRGTRFPGAGYYAFPAETLPQNVDFTGFRFSFRLQKPSGLLIFAATENQQEYVAVLFKGGRPRFMFDTQGGCKQFFPGVTTYNDEGLRYNDGLYHTFVAMRWQATSSVTVDDKWIGQTSIQDEECRNSHVIGPTTELFVGGLPEHYKLRRDEPRNSHLKAVFFESFQGCIDKLEVLVQNYPEEVWKELDWSEGVSYDLVFLNWQGCPINLDTGVHFMGKGYMSLPNCVDDGCLLSGKEGEINIGFVMRTTLHTFLLFIVYGGDNIYMHAFMERGDLFFEVMDGKDKVTVTSGILQPSIILCDGMWHELQFKKVNSELSIIIDGIIVHHGNQCLAMVCPLVSNVYLGGIKPNSALTNFIDRNKVVLPQEGFGGCIKELMLNSEPVALDSVIDLANVNMDGCPLFHVPELTCEDSVVSTVYTGPGLVAYDYGLLPYTDYIYRVNAHNSHGQCASPWGYGRTREGAPVGVGMPTSLSVYSGYVVQVEWDEPESTSGLLTKTIVTAYNVNSMAVPPTTVEVFGSVNKKVNLTNLTPSTNYSITITLCTSGGCTESLAGRHIFTPEEAPEGVSVPFVVMATDTTLLLSWNSPAKPNGNITGYFLYRDAVEVYRGIERKHINDGLRVFTSYSFYVRACTSVASGCTDGPSIFQSTAQLPPSLVQSPLLVVKDAHTLDVMWQAPEQVNGVLERYVVYLSEQNGVVGEVVINTTVLATDCVLGNLVPGTMYFVSVAACTGGGCRISEPTGARLFESSPTGIIPPVFSTTPFTIRVSWQPPLHSNGIITSYSLFQNDVLIAKGTAIFSHTLTDLLPYSLHVFKLEVCTVQGCGYSDSKEVRMCEASPDGNVVLMAEVMNSRIIRVNWTRPEYANGLLFFEVYVQGSFYVDPDNLNYTLVMERRGLLRVQTSYTSMEVGPLVPMVDYDIQVNASNTQGYVLSNVVSITMPPGTPDGVYILNVSAESSTSVLILWSPVGRANSPEEVSYVLQFRHNDDSVIRDEFGPTSTLAYLMSGLKPFTSYQFRLSALSSYGSTVSAWITAKTAQDRPSRPSPPHLTVHGSRCLALEWIPPINTNGILLHYKLFQDTEFRTEIFPNMSSCIVCGLTPYTDYSFKIEACTVIGCSLSESSNIVRTLPDVSDGISVPLLKALAPTAVQVKWSQPKWPNGVILQYILERQLAKSTVVSLVENFIPADGLLKYIDSSPVLAPFRVYAYRLKVVNTAGVATGPWAIVTTLSSRPAGVRPPMLLVRDSRTIEVKWREPLQSNGIIERYVLDWTENRHEFRNFTILKTVLSYLTPFTEYHISVIACTVGGCSQSLPASATTFSDMPSGQRPAQATASSQSVVIISWLPPTSPNGPDLHYELSRRIVRRPLLRDIVRIAGYISVYQGSSLYNEDSNLTVFTTYVYRVTVFNRVGQSTSADSNEVTTFGGFPRKAPIVSASALSHQEILVAWTIPDLIDLEGEVQCLSLTANYVAGVLTEGLMIGSENVTLTKLLPNTLYTIMIFLTIFGGASVSSTPVNVITLDGAPEGIPLPDLTVINSTALIVMWRAPTTPRGEITTYNIIVDGVAYPTNSTISASLTLTDLLPFTVYNIQVEACTVYKCSRSESTFAATNESEPLGVDTLETLVLNSTAVHVLWSPPSHPNGVIMHYELWRSNCSKMVNSDMNRKSHKCTYVQCRIFESLCGHTCHNGYKVCCDDVLHDRRIGYGCCGKLYIKMSSPEAICCAGKFYLWQSGYTCCGNRFLPVKSGEVCCPSMTEDRVDTGPGDSCCGNIPYYVNGSQICCADDLYNGYRQLCCGGVMVPDNSLCCGNSISGQRFLVQPKHMCCGQVYIDTETSLCCQSNTSCTKIHYYSSNVEKQALNEVCCGVEAIASGLACCNYVGYDPDTHVCADHGHSMSGCGTGVTCPANKSDTAFCDMCDYNSDKTCASVQLFDEIYPSSRSEDDSSCPFGNEVIYIGEGFAYTDVSLLAFTKYRYSIVAVNSAGTASSPDVEVTTMAAAPNGVTPLLARVDPDRLNIIYLHWQEPDWPNGILEHFIVLRDGKELYRGLSREFIDHHNVLPYRSYLYTLSVCNVAGCTNSIPITVLTAEGTPDNIPPVVVGIVESTCVEITVLQPLMPNGQVQNFTVLVNPMKKIIVLDKPQTIVLEDLTPYARYSVRVEVCNDFACGISPYVSLTTAESAPQGIGLPYAIVKSPTTMDVFWNEPAQMNGLLLNYTLSIVDVGLERVEYIGINLSALITDLIAGGTYTLMLEVSTTGGSEKSSPVDIIMPTSAPMDLPLLHDVHAVNSTTIIVSWNQSSKDAGDVELYRVILNAGKESWRVDNVGLALTTTFTGLKPFTYYEVRLQACLVEIINGCATGSPVVVRTTEAPPLGQPAPVISALSSNTVQINWKPPDEPNGNILFYQVFRRVEGNKDVALLVEKVRGDVRSVMYTGLDLKPFTVYQFGLVASNSEGETDTVYSAVRTLQSVPVGMSIPAVRSHGAYSVTVSWSAPSHPNGVIVSYCVYYKVAASSLNFLDFVAVGGDVLWTSVSGLRPHTMYSLMVEVLNGAGRSTSSVSDCVTQQASPSGLRQFHAEPLNTGTAIILRWDFPDHPNGVITSYNVLEIAGSRKSVFGGLMRFFEFRRLTPFTNYTLLLEACTVAGCTFGDHQMFTTSEIPPDGQHGPTFDNVTSNSVSVRWSLPLKPNGIMLSYDILRRSRSVGYDQLGIANHYSSEEVVHHSSDTDSMLYQYTDIQLSPYTQYEYKIRSINSKGFTSSVWKMVQTEQAPPLGVQSPMVFYANGSIDSVNVTWLRPQKINGVLQRYQLDFNGSSVINVSAGGVLSRVVRHLLLNTLYSVSLLACSDGGCTSSLPTFFRTKVAPPRSVSSPVLTAVDESAIYANWSQGITGNDEVIMTYKLEMNRVVVYKGVDTEFIVSGLVSFQEYTFVLIACTLGGCSRSDDAVCRLEDSAPSGMRFPVLREIRSAAIEISWFPPDNPNGIISSYKVKRDGMLIFVDIFELGSLLSTSYTDYNLQPGKEYSYTIIAYNRKGSAESPPSTLRMYSSSPSGVDSPLLIVMSSTSIQAHWYPPSHPNGEIVNYTLYQANRVVYSGPPNKNSYTLSGLSFYTLYTFRLLACTEGGCHFSSPASMRTLQAPAQLIVAPLLTALTDEDGAHHGVLVVWKVPEKPNGIILFYQLQRRPGDFKEPGEITANNKLVYNGTELHAIDKDSQILPFRHYEYMLIVVNGAGDAHSPWASVVTRQAPPTSVQSPSVTGVTATTITVLMFEPDTPNGIIRQYIVQVNGIVHASSLSLQQTVGIDFSLQPSTSYSIVGQVCTGGGCTDSAPVIARTASTVPSDLDLVTVLSINSTAAVLVWDYPARHHGQILKFSVFHRTSCPLTEQPFHQSCAPGESLLVYEGMNTSVWIRNLLPYIAYQFMLVVTNEVGQVGFPQWVNATTDSSAPLFLHLPRLLENDIVVEVTWTDSFQLNGMLLEYLLRVDGMLVYRGVNSTYSFQEILVVVIRVEVEVVTHFGQAFAPIMPFQLSTGRSTFTTTEQPVTTSMWFQETWFIVMVSIIGVLICCVLLGIYLHCSLPSRQWTQERLAFSDALRNLTHGIFLQEVNDVSVIGGHNADNESRSVTSVANDCTQDLTLLPDTYL